MYPALIRQAGRDGCADGKLPGGLRWPVVLLCVFLAGCSATRIIYNQLDWIIVWTISDSFSLNDEQEDRLRAAVGRNLMWHRRNQLPAYAQLLRGIENDASAGQLTLEQIQRHYARFMALWDEFIVQITPDMSAFILTLNQAQVDEFAKSLEESNEKLWEKYAGRTPGERQKRRREAAVKGLERLFGTLSDGQKDLVRAYMDGLHDVSLEWMAGRRQWQQAFRALIIERPPEPELSERMLRLMLDPNGYDSPDYRRRVAENRRTIMNMLAALHAGLTEKQRERFSRKLRKFARNFEILAGQST